MNDKELIEWASKAVGYELIPCSCSQGAFKTVHIKADPTHWNPIHDDGDCARMEATAGINIEWYQDYVVSSSNAGDSDYFVEFFRKHNGDKSKARRYA